MKLLIKNGRIIDALQNFDFKGNLLIEDDKIVEISKDEINAENAQIIDASDMIVAPGFIDLHVHLREPGFEYKENIKTGLNAAAAGGFTAVCPMPNTKPVADNAQTIAYMLEKAKEANGVKLYPISAASKNIEGKAIAPIGELKQSGAVAISDDGHPVEDTALLRRIMEYASGFDMTYISHSEDRHLSKEGQMNEGFFSTLYGMQGIPAVGEASQISRDCMLAEYLNLPIHIAHVSTEMSVSIIRYFKKRGVKVTAETAPHYISLTDEIVGSYDTNTKMNPPLRTQKDKEALIEAIADGTIDIIATDHAPHHEREKNVEYNVAPFGIVGLETAVPMTMKLVKSNKISLNKFVELFTKGYEILGIEGGKLEKGKKADITIFDEKYQWTIDKNMFKSKARNTPFHGFHVEGAVFYTIVDGKIVYSRSF